MSKDLLQHLRDEKLLGYGSVIPAALIQNFLGLSVPDIGTKADFDRLALQELSGIGYVRDHILNEGKYIAQVRDHYRILLPSENIAKVYGYMREASQKNARAQKLLASTPIKAVASPNDSLRARLLMQKDDLTKAQRKRNK
ncbi:MAG: hypothetical protein DRQ39_03715 [Gammaproteobacteria bacterium]|nr:MAG: hypothetical protein DRQ39_03715 [Gammaproteobacteria bacterium]